MLPNADAGIDSDDVLVVGQEGIDVDLLDLRGETEWMEFKTNIGESHCSVTYEGVGNYISGLSNSACLKYKSHGYLVLGVEDATWKVVGTNLRMPTAKYGNQDYELWLRRNCSPIIPFEIEEFDFQGDGSNFRTTRFTICSTRH